MSLSLLTRFYWRHCMDVRLSLFALALALSVASILTVTLVADRLNQATQYSGQRFLGADRVLSDNQPISKEWQQQAEKMGLETQTVINVVTILYANEQFELSAVRAIGDQYPFYGELILDPQQKPKPDEIWLSEQLKRLLGVDIGDEITLGQTTLRLGGLLIQAPEQRLTPALFAPQALIHQDALAKANIIVPGSRVKYRMLFKGTPEAITHFAQWIKPQLKSGQRFYGGYEGNTMTANALVRATQFFRLASLIGVLLGCVGMSIALYQYTIYQNQQVALLKTLGASSGAISVLNGFLILGTIVFGTLIGLVLGWASHQVVISFLHDILPKQLPTASLIPFLLAVSIAVLMGLVIAIIPFLRLLSIPVMRVLRSDVDSHLSVKWMFPIVTLGNLLLIWLFTRDIQLSLALIAGCFSALLLLALLGWFFLRITSQLPTGGGVGFGLRYLRKNLTSSLSQSALVAFSLMLVASLWALQGEILNDLKSNIPPDAPNRFVMNIPVQDKEKIEVFFQQHSIQTSDFYPIIRGRLIAINDMPVQQFKDESGREGVYRPLNLTWRTTPPPNNPIVEGQWRDEENSVSIEADFAQRLGIELGDSLVMRIGSQQLTTTVTSIREVDWQSFQPNFYLIFSPKRMQTVHHSWLTSFRVDAQQRDSEIAFMKQFPSVVVINVENIMQRIEQLTVQLSHMLGVMVFLVILLCIIVLMIQAQAAMLERYEELVLMRTFGAGQKFLQVRLMTEFSILGLISGVSAIAATQSMSACLYWFWLKQQVPFLWSLWLALPFLGIVIVGIGIWPNMHSLLRATLSNRLKQL